MAIRPEYAKRIAIHQYKIRRNLGKTLFPYASSTPQEVRGPAAIPEQQRDDEASSPIVKQQYLSALESIVAAISQKSDKIKVLSDLLPQIMAMTKAEIGALLVVGDETAPQNGKPHNFIVITWREMPDEIVKQLTGGDLAQKLLAGQQLWLQPQPLRLNAPQALLGRHKVKYLWAQPFLSDGEILGAIVIGSRKFGISSLSSELQLQLATLVQLVAMFLDNIRLRNRQHQAEIARKQASPASSSTNQPEDLEELLAAVMSAEEEVANQNRDLGLLNALSNEIGSTLQLEVILEAAVSQTKNLLQTESSWCYMLENGNLVLRTQSGLSERYVAGMKFLEPGNGVEGMAFSRKQPIVRDGLLFHSGNARTLMKEEGLRMIAAVPLLAQGKTFGVLAAAKHHTHTWTARDERMLASIGRQVGQAIANAHRFTAVQEQAQTLEVNYGTLQQTNVQLSRRAELLEMQLSELRQIEKQIWMMLAASTEARRKLGHKPTGPYDEDVVLALKKVLAAIGERQESRFLELT